MRFKEYYTEGRNKWDMFQLRKCDKRWSFVNLETKQRYFIKINDPNNAGGMQKFLEDILATDSTVPKTKGTVDFKIMADDIMSGKKSQIHVKSGMWDKIKKTWIVEEE
jgi:hypothetical protein